MPSISLSVLDLAVVNEGLTIHQTLNNTVKLAQHVEQLDYKRFWMAEHHNMMNVASSATAVLIAHIAGQTKKIRVGSGGVMLPNHTPLIVAEQFGTLESLFPNRIDLGLGRAPGTDQATAYEIRGERIHAAQDFPRDVIKLLHFLADNNEDVKVRAFPGNNTKVPVWILGSSTQSALLAATYGLPYAFASHFAPTYFFEAIDIYRTHFRPSEYLKEPYIIACVNVIASDTDEKADFLSSSLKMQFKGIITNSRKYLQAPVQNMNELWTDMEQLAVEQMLSMSFIGGKSKLKEQISSFIQKSNIDELMVNSNIYDFDAKLYSYQILKEVVSNI